MNIMQAILGGRQDDRVVLDKIFVPADKIEEVLQVIDDTNEATELVGQFAQLWRRWRTLHGLIPILKDKEARFNTQNILQPFFEIIGDTKRPEPSRLVKSVNFVPEEKIAESVKVIDESMRKQTLTCRYYQWRYFEGLFPDLEITQEAAVTINFNMGEWIALVELFTDDKDQA